MLGRHYLLLTLIALSIGTDSSATAQSQARTQQPARDTPAQRSEPVPTPKGRISGQVLAADNARPVRRARVLISAAEVPGGRGMLTDDNGSFDFTELPAGRYTVTVSKTGFVSLSYGQRRPLQAGTPLQLADAQELTGIDFRLPRGSVIAGHILDESGDPLPGAAVQVMRYQYAQGNRQLVPAGGAQTDDQGSYRVWGLNPGDYYVSAVTRSLDLGGRGGFAFGGAAAGRGGRGAAIAGLPPGAAGQIFSARGLPPPGAAQTDAEPVGYAPTFYPGVPSVNDARAVTVGLGVEVVNIDFGVLLVHTGRVSGHVTNPDGSPTTAGNVNLMPDTGATARVGPGRMMGSRVQWDGAFSIANVPPGRYTLRARSEDSERPQFAVQPVVVGEGDLSDLIIVLAPGATITGTVTFQSTQSTSIPDVNQLRIAAPPIDFANNGPNPTARVDKDGTFAIDGVAAGSHLIRTQGGPRGWTLRSVTLSGREIIDAPIDLRAGQKLTGVSIVFSDKISEVNGTLTDDRGTPVTEFTVLAFPTDATLWRPQARQIMTARPDQNGKYQIRGLPPGDYFLTAVDPAEQGEWFEPAFLDPHRTGAARLTLGDGDVKTQDFKLNLR